MHFLQGPGAALSSCSQVWKAFPPMSCRVTAGMSFLPDKPPPGHRVWDDGICQRSVRFSVRKSLHTQTIPGQQDNLTGGPGWETPTAKCRWLKETRACCLALSLLLGSAFHFTLKEDMLEKYRHTQMAKFCSPVVSLLEIHPGVNNLCVEKLSGQAYTCQVIYNSEKLFRKNSSIIN